MGSYIVKIDQSTCSICEECISTCEEGVFWLTDKQMVDVKDNSLCTNCGACIEICPSQCITVNESLESRAKTREQAMTLRRKRKEAFKQAMEGKSKAPVKEIMALLEIGSVEELEEWLLESGSFDFYMVLDDYVEDTR
jgi:Na+-translocating ferredoxin:NAD+ oxidoreductase RNF subunit RnfB